MILVTIRVTLFAIFLYTSLVISWASVVSFVLLLVSFFLLTDEKESPKTSIIDFSKNPLKGKPRMSISNISPELIHQVEHEICEFVTYDAEYTQSLHHFERIKQNTECIFAKRAKLWGSPDWKEELSLEENVLRSVPTFLKFSSLCLALGLDGFVYELPGICYGKDVHTFGAAVRRVLTLLSDNDPAGIHCMDRSYIDKKGWVFEFNKVTYFITTFAPCYPSTNSRYAFEAKNAYILLQPEISFAQHDLPPDSPNTEWNNPKTVRDRIRVAFYDAGRGYEIRDTILYPMVHDIVKPLHQSDPVVEWWVKD